MTNTMTKTITFTLTQRDAEDITSGMIDGLCRWKNLQSEAMDKGETGRIEYNIACNFSRLYDVLLKQLKEQRE